MYQTLRDLNLTDSQREELNFFIRQAERYEKLRNVNSLQFCDLFHEHLKTGVEFDALVDDLE